MLHKNVFSYIKKKAICTENFLIGNKEAIPVNLSSCLHTTITGFIPDVQYGLLKVKKKNTCTTAMHTTEEQTRSFKGYTVRIRICTIHNRLINIKLV